MDKRGSIKSCLAFLMLVFEAIKRQERRASESVCTRVRNTVRVREGEIGRQKIGGTAVSLSWANSNLYWT
jgi:hypothetical protein